MLAMGSILVVSLLLSVITSRRGWGYIPFAIIGGCTAIFVIVGLLTGAGIIPDGVDIFTFLGCCAILLVSNTYMLLKSPNGTR